MNTLIDKEEKSSIYFKLFNLLTEKLGIKFTPVRLKHFSKVPVDKGWADPNYDPNLINWVRFTGNIGIIPGRSDLLIIDCDTPESIKFFVELANRLNLPTETLVVKTRRGAHYYYYCPFSNELEKRQFTNQAQNIKIDLLAGSKCQVVAPYSQLKVDKEGKILDPSAKDYFLFVYEPSNIPEKLPEISKDTYNQLITELEKTLLQTKENKPTPQRENFREQEEQRELTDEEIEELVQILSEYFQEGRRQQLLFFTSGFLRKNLNVSEESIYRLYERLQPIDDPEDLRGRIGAIKKTYEKEIKILSGKKGLIDLLGEETANELCNRIEQVLSKTTKKTPKPAPEIEPEIDKTEEESTESKKKRKSIATLVRLLFLQYRENFWLSEHDEAYFTLEHKHYRVESKQFKDYLQEFTLNKFEQPLNKNALDEVLAFFRHWARENAEKEKKKYKVFSRVGYSQEENFIEINLLRDDYKVLRITPNTIEIDYPKLKFVPGRNQLPLTHFNYEILQDMQKHKLTAKEILSLFKQVFNIQTVEELALLIAWAIKTFYEPGEYPILFIAGEREGVGKTTFCKFLTQLLDPTTTPVKTLPPKIDDLFVLAKENFILTFDNVSYLDEDLSDALCQLSTGGTLSKRKLYTDFDVVDIPLKRPVILNSIFQIAQRRDLRRRSIILELKKPEQVKSLKELQENFNKFAPFLYSYLILCVQEALKEKIVEASLLDIADFCEFIAKSHPVFFMPPNEFMETLKNNREEAAKDALESNLLVPVILNKLEESMFGIWKTTAKELLEELKKHYPGERKLPSTPEHLGRELRKIASDLEALNIKVEFLRTQNRREIVFTKLSPPQSDNANDDDIPF